MQSCDYNCSQIFSRILADNKTILLDANFSQRFGFIYPH